MAKPVEAAELLALVASLAGRVAGHQRGSPLLFFPQSDSLISDVDLPDGTGIELMEDLHAKYGLRGIALTGYGMEDDVRRPREVGFVEHLVKPVDFAQLRRALILLAISK